MPSESLQNLVDTPDGSLLDLVVATAPDAIVTADSEGTILSFSPAAERIFGYAEEEVAGRNLGLLMPEAQGAAHDGCLRTYLRTGEKRIIGVGREVHARRKSGEIFVAELAVGELVLGARRIFTGFLRDVTERVEAEARVRELQRRLEKVARLQMLGEMSSALAHELNQPLTAISNFARAAERTLGAEAPDTGTLGAHVAAISEQALRAGEIIRRMRLMVDRGRAQIRPDDINEIIREAVRAEIATSGHTGPEITLDLAEDLPPVYADRILVQQVILNLLKNAVEAVDGDDAPELRIASALGGERGRIRLRVGTNHAEVVVTVSDSGPGLDEALRERIFEPLVTTKPEGLGVGLAVCRTIVEAHEGRIWAENLPEGGAAFHFTLPAATA